MYKVMIVDDETIVRTTLHTMIDWEQQGFEIVADAQNGEQAWNLLQNLSIDILFTDIKMPIMDGITLIRKVKSLPSPPSIIVLSGYNDFELVRESFLLGVADYLLKADISEVLLLEILSKLSISSCQKEEVNSSFSELEADAVSPQKLLANMALGKTNLQASFFHGNFVLAQMEIDHFQTHLNRFGQDPENSLIRPLLNFAMQIPRVASRCKISILSASHYLLYYETEDSKEETAYESTASICKQIAKVWENYMNIPVSIGLSSFGRTPEDFPRCYLETAKSLSVKYLFRQKHIFAYASSDQPTIATIIRESSKYELFRDYLHTLDESSLQTLRQNFFSQMSVLPVAEARNECLYMIYAISVILRDTGNDLWTIFDDGTDYMEKIFRLDSLKSLDIWMTNYLRFIMDYMENHYDRQQADMIERAKRFIRDNYSNPEMSLGKAAGFAGLSEKYFSSRFTKEVGSTFSNYLTAFRMERAKELLLKTDKKMYEISESVGYNNVEHFTRVFKKEFFASPNTYKKDSTKYQ